MVTASRGVVVYSLTVEGRTAVRLMTMMMMIRVLDDDEFNVSVSRMGKNEKA